LSSSVDHRFGRCQNFLILNEDGELEKSIENKGMSAARGAGVQAAQSIVNEGISVLITGNIGPNAFRVLQGSGVEIYLTSGLSIKEAFEKWKNNELNRAESPSGPPGRGRGGRRGSGRGRRTDSSPKRR